MKSLFLTRKFPPSVGGMERYAYDLHASISKKTDVTLLKWGGSNKWLPFVLPWLMAQSLWRLATQKIDVIHMQDGVLAPIGYILKLLFRKPLVVVVHGLDVTYQNPIFKRVVPWALRRADKVICISSAARDEVVKRGVDPDKAMVITLGVEDTLFSGDHDAARQRLIQKLNLPQDVYILVSVGRLVQRKGIAWFVDHVMPKLMLHDTHIALVVSGDGSEREVIEQAIHRHGLDKHVFLLGRTSDAMRKDLYNGSDVFVMPNIVVPGDMEGFGLVLVEAATCELPVVAAGIEGITDAIKNDQNGFLVKSGNVQQFERKILEILQDKPAAQAFGTQARAYTLAHYDWKVIGDAFIREYEKLSQRDN